MLLRIEMICSDAQYWKFPREFRKKAGWNDCPIHNWTNRMSCECLMYEYNRIIALLAFALSAGRY